MVDPPPTATKASKPPCVAKSIASRKETSVGSTRTRSKRANEIRLSRRDSRAVATGWSRARLESVSTITRCAFISARSIPTSRVTPGPKRMLEEASSNPYSTAMKPSSGNPHRSHPPAEPEDGKAHGGEDHRASDARRRGEHGERAA